MHVADYTIAKEYLSCLLFNNLSELKTTTCDNLTDV